MSPGRQSADGCGTEAGSIATYLVTVAGSAGAFVPLCQFVSSLPSDFGAAVAVVMHSGPGSVLARVLQNRSRIRISPASQRDLLSHACVYVAMHGTHLIINPDAHLSVSDAPPVGWFRPSADWLFESAAASFRERHIAVVLSGLLSDGAARLRAVKRCGSTVFVQSPAEAQYREMPDAAIATGCVDAILRVDRLISAIQDVLSQRNMAVDAASWEAPFDQEALVA
jgi:two-component system, chemotaxis family, protein-glutamate methylesterase/glutaminase